VRIGEAKNQKELVEACEQARQRRLEHRRGWETIWWNNIALLAGDHHATWNPSLSQFEDRDPQLEGEGKKPRLVLNHALTVGRTELAKLTKSRPIMEVVANSDSDVDIAATKVGRATLDAAEWTFKLKKKRKSALWWAIATGVGAIFVGYDFLDDESGNYRYLIDPMTNEATFNPDRKQQLEEMVDKGELAELTYEEFPLGQLEYKVYSPFQLFPDETVLELDDCKDLITTEAADVDVVKGMYGKSAENVTPEQVQLGVMETRQMQRLQLSAPTEQTAENAMQIHTFWLLPGVYRGNKYLEQGVFLRWCQSRKVLDISVGKGNKCVFPFADNRMPFAFFQHIPTATSVWPDCVMTHIRGPNLEIDKTVSQLVENKDYMANPMWRIAAQHKIRGEIKNVAGAIVRYTHVPNVPPPEPVEGLQMPAQVENLLVGLREQILDISGQSEVARGRVPTGVRSGVAVAYLQEEDDTKLAPTVENMEEATAYMGSLTLCRFQQFYSTTRMLRYYKPDGTFDVVKFKGADLRNNTDVIPQAGSAMPRSKAAQQQYTLELVQLGILQDPEQIKEILEIGKGSPNLKDKARRQAERENQIMLHGMPKAMFNMSHTVETEDLQKVSAAIPVKAWHDHAVHIERHTSVMMDPEFDELQISHPEVVRLFDEHLAVHQQEMAKQQQQQMMMLQAAKGAPDGKPAGQQAKNPMASGQPGQPDMTAMNAMQPAPQGAATGNGAQGAGA
jgi:hypothetical protein